MGDRDQVEWTLKHKLVIYVTGALVSGYVVLAVSHPVIWAVATAVLFVLGAGLLTTRTVLRIESGLLMAVMTPLFGMCWLLFFYLLWLLRKLAA